MPASLFHETEDSHTLGSTAGNGIEDQRALQLALELSILGLTDWENMGPSFNEAEGRKKSQNTTECVPVPSSEHVAEIVGRQGCKIKALRAKTNTYIKTPVRGEEPVFVVTGRKEDVNAAKREILSAAEHFSQIRAQRKNNLNGGLAGPGPNSNIPGQTTIQVRVPYRVVGLVVGPKGATIKRIQQQTNTYIITPSRDKEPIFEVTGLPESVETARKEIEAHIAMRTGGVIDSSSGGGSISPSNGDLGDGGLDAFGLGGSPHVFDDGQFSLYKGAFDLARKKMEAMRRGSMLGGDSSSGGGSISPPSNDLTDSGLDAFGLGGSPHAFDDGHFSLFKSGPFEGSNTHKKTDALRRGSMLGDSSSGSSISPSNGDLTSDNGLEPFGLGGSPQGFDEGQFSLYKGAYELARKKMEAMARRGSGSGVGLGESSSGGSSLSPSNGDLDDNSPDFDGGSQAAGAFSSLYKSGAAFDARKKQQQQNETQPPPATGTAGTMQRRGSSTLDSDFQMYYGY